MGMSEKIKACSFTGYRPNKFDFPLSAVSPQYKEFENRLLSEITAASDGGCREYFCGMAWGFDILAGEAVILLKKMRPRDNIKLIAVVPFLGQEKSWDAEWQRRYSAVLSAADRVVYISQNYANWAYHKRNRYMVDNSDTVITFFDGKSGGTAATLRYAGEKGKRIINLAAEKKNEKIYFSPYIVFDDEDI